MILFKFVNIWLSERPAHLADGWHLLCQARDSSTISGPVETMGGGASASPQFGRSVNPIQIGEGG